MREEVDLLRPPEAAFVSGIAVKAGAGEPIERIRDAYPSLTDRQIQLAVIYATAQPAARAAPRHRPARRHAPSRAQGRAAQDGAMKVLIDECLSLTLVRSTWNVLGRSRCSPVSPPQATDAVGSPGEFA